MWMCVCLFLFEQCGNIVVAAVYSLFPHCPRNKLDLLKPAGKRVGMLYCPQQLSTFVSFVIVVKLER